MKKLYYAIVELAGTGTEGIEDSTYVKMQNQEINWDNINSEERAAIKQRIANEAAYIKGFVDGIRMAKMSDS